MPFDPDAWLAKNAGVTATPVADAEQPEAAQPLPPESPRRQARQFALGVNIFDDDTAAKMDRFRREQGETPPTRDPVQEWIDRNRKEQDTKEAWGGLGANVVGNVASGMADAGGRIARAVMPPDQRDVSQSLERGTAAWNEELDAVTPLSPFANQVIRGTSNSLTTVAMGRGLGLGQYGLAGMFGAVEAGNAWHDAKEAGLSDADAALYAARAGTIEAGIASVFSALGAGGLEKILGGGGQLKKSGLKEVLKQTGISSLQELPEEILTETAHLVNQRLSGVQKEELTGQQFWDTVAATTAQTLLSVGLASGTTGLAQQRGLREMEKAGYHYDAETKQWQPATLAAEAATPPATPTTPPPPISHPAQPVESPAPEVNVDAEDLLGTQDRAEQQRAAAAMEARVAKRKALAAQPLDVLLDNAVAAMGERTAGGWDAIGQDIRRIGEDNAHGRRDKNAEEIGVVLRRILPDGFDADTREALAYRLYGVDTRSSADALRALWQRVETKRRVQYELEAPQRAEREAQEQARRELEAARDAERKLEMDRLAAEEAAARQAGLGHDGRPNWGKMDDDQLGAFIEATAPEGDADAARKNFPVLNQSEDWQDWHNAAQGEMMRRVRADAEAEAGEDLRAVMLGGGMRVPYHPGMAYWGEVSGLRENTERRDFSRLWRKAEKGAQADRDFDKLRERLVENGFSQYADQEGGAALLTDLQRMFRGERVMPDFQVEEERGNYGEGDSRGDADKKFSVAIDALIEGKWDRTRDIPVGNTPAVLRAVGADDLPIVVSPGVIEKVTTGRHDLPPDLVKKIPAALSDPVFIFDSASIPDAQAVVTELRHGSANVMVAIHLNRRAGRAEVNRIASIYDKTNEMAIPGWMRAGLLRYAHQQKSRAWFQSRGLQLPKEGSKRSNKNLLTEDDLVKSDFRLEEVQTEFAFPQTSNAPITDPVERTQWDVGKEGREVLAGKIAALAKEPGALDAYGAKAGDVGRRVGWELQEKGSANSVISELVNGQKNAAQLVGLKIARPADLASALWWLRDPYQERFGVAVLAEDGQTVIAAEVLTMGTLNSSLADAKLVARTIAKAGPRGKHYVLFHNHPSGDPYPSRADHRVTQQMNLVPMPNGAKLLDHVVTNGDRFYSFANNSMSDVGRTEPMPEGTPRPDWETVPRERLFEINSPRASAEVMRGIYDIVRPTNPDTNVILYMSTKLSLVGAELIPAGLSAEQLAARIVAGAARNGAASVQIGLPKETHDRSASRQLRELLEMAGVQVDDMLLGSGRPQSMREMGVMEGEERQKWRTTGGSILTAPGLVTMPTAGQSVQETVYHGSPHRFDRMDTAHIGSGEGNQAYGWGLYVAQNPFVARHYAEKLAKKGGENVYEMEIDIKPEDLLNWEGYYDEMPKAVREKLEVEMDMYRASEGTKGAYFGASHTGEAIYREFVRTYGSPAAASQRLLELGVRAIKFSDGLTRQGAGGTSNYVVFDPALVRVLARNGEPLDARKSVGEVLREERAGYGDRRAQLRERIAEIDQQMAEWRELEDQGTGFTAAQRNQMELTRQRRAALERELAQAENEARVMGQLQTGRELEQAQDDEAVDTQPHPTTAEGMARKVIETEGAWQPDTFALDELTTPQLETFIRTLRQEFEEARKGGLYRVQLMEASDVARRIRDERNSRAYQPPPQVRQSAEDFDAPPPDTSTLEEMAALAESEAADRAAAEAEALLASEEAWRTQADAFTPAAPEREYEIRPKKTIRPEGSTFVKESFFTKLGISISKYFQGFKGPLRSLPVTGEDAPKYSRVREGFLELERGVQRALRQATTEVQTVLEPILHLQEPIHKAEYERLGNLHAKLAKADAALEKARRTRLDNPDLEKKVRELEKQIEAMQGTLENDAYYIFQNFILYRDFLVRQEQLHNDRGEPITLPFNLNPAEVKQRAEYWAEKAKSHPAKGAILAAVKRHEELVTESWAEMERRDALKAATWNGGKYYFPHVVLEKWSGGLQKYDMGNFAEMRSYLRDPKGSKLAIETDYLKAMIYHMTAVHADNIHQDVVQNYFKPYDIADQLKKQAAEQGVDWRSLINPHTHEVFTPTDAVALHNGFVIDRNALAKAVGRVIGDGPIQEELKKMGVGEIKVSAAMIKEAMLAGEKEQWVVPKVVADALGDIQRMADLKPGPLAEKLMQYTTVWKQYQLLFPTNTIRYNFNNILPDTQRLLTASPRVFLKLASPKVWKDTIKELAPFFDGSNEVSQDVIDAWRHGVFDTPSKREVNAVQKSPIFRKLGNPDYLDVETLWDLLLKPGETISQFREAVYRFLLYKHNLQRYKNNAVPDYGGAYWRDIEAIEDSTLGANDAIQRKAAAISLRTLNDFGALSENGRNLRRFLIPFYSFMETNMRWFINSMRNGSDMMFKPGEFANGAYKNREWVARRAAAGMALRMFAPLILLQLFNELFWGDEGLEDQLSAEDRRRPHIILGKDSEGRVQVMYLNNDLAEVFRWFGGNRVAGGIMDVLAGRSDFATVAQDWAANSWKDAANSALGLHPAVSAIYTGASGKAIFPDVTDQKSIPKNDIAWHMLGQMTDINARDLVRLLADKDYYSSKDFGDWFSQAVFQIRRRDPEQWAYYSIRDKAAEYLEERTGRSVDRGTWDAPEAQVLRNWRRAIYRGDVENAMRFYNRLLHYGYTAERLASSIRSQDPLADLPKLDGTRKAFVDQLNEQEKAELERAWEYYRRMSTLRGRERELFPREIKNSAEATQRNIDRFRENPNEDMMRRLIEDRNKLDENERRLQRDADQRRSLQVGR